MRLPRATQPVVLLGFLLCATNCLLAPFDGEYFKSQSAAINFVGASDVPGSLILIEACSHPLLGSPGCVAPTSTYQAIGLTSASSSVSFTDSHNRRWISPGEPTSLEPMIRSVP
jgi:hypothetical protein